MHNEGFPKVSVKNRKIKALINSEFGNTVGFLKMEPQGRGAKTLVYNTAMTVEEALTAGWNLNSIDKTNEIAMHLRSSVKNAFNAAEPLPWPPTPEDLEKQCPKEILPESMVSFLTTLIDGKEQSNEKNQRVILSLCQVLYIQLYYQYI